MLLVLYRHILSFLINNRMRQLLRNGESWQQCCAFSSISDRKLATCCTSKLVLYFDLTESEPMVESSENNGLPFQPFHRPRSNTGGSAWLMSGAILACGVALPGLCLAWQWKQTTVTEPVPLMVTIVIADALFILTATVFLSTGGLFGRQRYPVICNYPGPFKEQDGSYFPPAYVQPYVMTAALLFGVVTPTIVLGSLLWRRDIILGVCTLGVYLLEVAAQLISETVYVRKDGPDWLWALQAGLLVLWVFNLGVVMSWTPWLYRWHLQPDSSQKPSAKTN